MKKFLVILAASAIAVFFSAGSASASTIQYGDIDRPGDTYYTGMPDQIGSPAVGTMTVILTGGYRTRAAIHIGSRLEGDRLFANRGSDREVWEYAVIGTDLDNDPGEAIYNLGRTYTYTSVKSGSYERDWDGVELIYKFDVVKIGTEETDVAAMGCTQCCANDGIVGEVPTLPEPATMLPLGAGLLGLAELGRKRFFKK